MLRVNQGWAQPRLPSTTGPNADRQDAGGTQPACGSSTAFCPAASPGSATNALCQWWEPLLCQTTQCCCAIWVFVPAFMGHAELSAYKLACWRWFGFQVPPWQGRTVPTRVILSTSMQPLGVLCKFRHPQEVATRARWAGDRGSTASEIVSFPSISRALAGSGLAAGAKRPAMSMLYLGGATDWVLCGAWPCCPCEQQSSEPYLILQHSLSALPFQELILPFPASVGLGICLRRHCYH